MKRYIISGFSAIALITAAATAASADEYWQNQPQSVTPTATRTAQQTTPFDLIHLARNGFLEAQGIPSHSALESGAQSGRITAVVLIRAGIAANRVSADVLNDAAYVRVVETLLSHLSDR